MNGAPVVTVREVEGARILGPTTRRLGAAQGYTQSLSWAPPRTHAAPARDIPHEGWRLGRARAWISEEGGGHG